MATSAADSVAVGIRDLRAFLALCDVLIDGARRAGVRLPVVDEVAGSTETAVVVTTGAVVGFATAIRAADLTWDAGAAGGLCPVPITDPQPLLDICAVWSPATDRPALRQVLACLPAEPSARMDPASVPPLSA